jgi:hypothetical protein
MEAEITLRVDGEEYRLSVDTWVPEPGTAAVSSNGQGSSL